MNIGDIVGQLMKDGLSPATQRRLQNAMGENGLGGLGGSGGLDSLLGGILGGSTSGGNPASSGGLSGILGSIGDVLSANSGVGGMSRGQVGGIGALAGAILGGGGSSVKGAIGGSAMAILGTLAISALQNWQQQGQSGSSAGVPTQGLSESDIRQMTAPQTAELCLRGMIEAVKSDGNIAREEVERIVGKLEEDGITPEERQFVTEHLQQGPDVRGLISAIPNREVAAQVYAAALMAITVDTTQERAFLADLARGTGLDAPTVDRLHAMVGAPPRSV